MNDGTMRWNNSISGIRRLWAMAIKEFIELKRDRITLTMIVSIPLIQLTLFGYAINVNPRHLPTAVLSQSSGSLSRSLLATLKATAYFDIVEEARSEADLDYLIKSGRAMFAIQIPQDFERKVRRGEKPAILIVADATDPAATGSAIATLEQLANRAFARDLRGPGHPLLATAAPFEIRIHRRFNPASETRLNIVPGLLGVILTMTMLIFTSLAVTRETEQGTMEGLLSMPLRPIEIMLGKITPYLLIGFAQLVIILIAARWIFDVPMQGSLALLTLLTLPFIAANLALGYTFSTLAQTQLQAVQMAFMFFLPNILLSGFMFPFHGMPQWAQYLGNALPLTHYIRIIRGIMLKQAGWLELSDDFFLMVLFMIIAMIVALLRFRRTLD